MKMPWNKGNDGWDYYSDFQRWFADQFTDDGYADNEEWIDNAPTFLMCIFENFAELIEKKLQEAKNERLRST